MGCWHQTCGLSRIHITPNDPVIAFLLIKQPWSTSFCEPGCLYDPLPIPIYGTYANYGEITGTDSFCLQVMLEAIWPHLRRGPRRTRFTKPPSLQDIWMASSFDASKATSVAFSTVSGKKYHLPLQKMLIHRQVFDAVLEDSCFEKVVDLIDAAITSAKKSKDIPENSPPFAWLNLLTNGLDSEIEIYGQSIDLSIFLLRPFVEQHVSAKVCRIADIVVDFLKKKQYMQLREFLVQYMKFVTLYAFTTETRILWSPQCGEGSQADSTKGYRTLLRAMDTLLSKQEEEET